MKLIIQIPCLNEEETLPLVFEKMPKKIKGIDVVETLIIDDGSSDNTVEIAKKLGVDHIVYHAKNRGLAKSFADGVDASLKLGADIIVNTDGDNQYPQESIPELVQPILEGKAEIVVADRQTHKIKHFSSAKKFLQRFGSKVVNRAAGTEIPDAASGFRAYSKKALLELNIITDFSYCMETIIHAGRKRIPITSVPVTTNPKTRESRLFKSTHQHVLRSASAIIRSYTMYKPFKIFILAGIFALIIGLIPFARFAYLFFISGDPVSGHIQSLLLGTVFVIISVLLFVLGVIADLISINRKLLEDALEKLKKLELDQDR
jgi:glycosyltransferase involved in cell wall biosynthesis